MTGPRTLAQIEREIINLKRAIKEGTALEDAPQRLDALKAEAKAKRAEHAA